MQAASAPGWVRRPADWSLHVQSLTVYLAGPVRGPRASWRDAFVAGYAQWARAHGMDSAWPLFVCPGGSMPLGWSDAPEAAPRVYMAADLVSVRRADVVVALLDAGETGRGTATELGIALERGIPVLALVRSDADSASWVFALAAGVSAYRSEEELYAALAYAAMQVSGLLRYDPARPG